MAVNIPGDVDNYKFKIVMLGDSGVGKSNIMTRFIYNEFNVLDSTIGLEVGYRRLHIDGKIIKAQLCDLTGAERFRGNISLHCRGAMGALLVYDITSHTSFKNVEQWLKDFRGYIYPDTKYLVIMLVGNKSDLDHRREVSMEEAKSFAEREKLLFIETSAFDATNVEEAFTNVLTQIYNNVQSL